MNILLLMGVLVAIVLFFYIKIEFRKAKDKIFITLFIVFILLSYFSFTSVLGGRNINFASFSGLSKAGSIYFSWLGSIFFNIKSITGNAIKMDWSGKNKTRTG